MKQTDFNELVNLIAKLAFAHPIDPRIFFKRIINQANLPERWTWEVAAPWTGGPKYDAQQIIIWALAKDINPNDKRFTALGSILEILLQEVGFEDAKFVVSLIFIYKLYRDNKLLEELQVTYQVPIYDTNITPIKSDFAPEMTLEEANETELESWYNNKTIFLDVGFLVQAIEKATSVCRIETLNQEILGTGFLIAEKLVLTNYHVLNSKITDTQRNTSDIILRFGCFTSATGNEKEGQIFKLVNDKPILQSSPTEKLDYVLLKVEENIKLAENIAPAVCEFNTLTQKEMGLYVMQHPQGDSMKIAISKNAIANVSSTSGLIQYFTKTSPGSSGSPCFNEEWKVVALHHAQKAISIGSIQEGILLSSIYQEIKQHL